MYGFFMPRGNVRWYSIFRRVFTIQLAQIFCWWDWSNSVHDTIAVHNLYLFREVPMNHVDNLCWSLIMESLTSFGTSSNYLEVLNSKGNIFIITHVIFYGRICQSRLSFPYMESQRWIWLETGKACGALHMHIIYQTHPSLISPKLMAVSTTHQRGQLSIGL